MIKETRPRTGNAKHFLLTTLCGMMIMSPVFVVAVNCGWRGDGVKKLTARIAARYGPVNGYDQGTEMFLCVEKPYEWTVDWQDSVTGWKIREYERTCLICEDEPEYPRNCIGLWQVAEKPPRKVIGVSAAVSPGQELVAPRIEVYHKWGIWNGQVQYNSNRWTGEVFFDSCVSHDGASHKVTFDRVTSLSGELEMTTTPDCTVRFARWNAGGDTKRNGEYRGMQGRALCGAF